jgi:predicted nuclease of predicted toxin-antitoxin system
MIRIKIDECLPSEIAEILIERGYETETVKSEGLTGSPDSLIWKVAQAEKRFLITSDLDFSDIRLYVPGTHQGVLLLRLSKEGKNHVLSYVKKILAEFDLNELNGCLVVATDHKIRVKKPK